MGAPKVSRAILTMSMARTTPAQKPRGLSKSTRFVGVEVSVESVFVGWSKAVVVTFISIPACRLLRELGFGHLCRSVPQTVIGLGPRVRRCRRNDFAERLDNVLFN